MTTHREVMQQALETLNFLKRGMDSGHIKCRTFIVHDPDATQAEIKHPVELVNNDIAAISAALAEPQEPVDDLRLLLRNAVDTIKADEALLRQALEMLEHMPVKHPDQLAQRRKLLNSIEDRLNLTEGS
jgi:hypothetical protein